MLMPCGKRFLHVSFAAAEEGLEQACVNSSVYFMSLSAVASCGGFAGSTTTLFIFLPYSIWYTKLTLYLHLWSGDN
jgi:hypothetical protein